MDYNDISYKVFPSNLTRTIGENRKLIHYQPIGLKFGDRLRNKPHSAGNDAEFHALDENSVLFHQFSQEVVANGHHRNVQAAAVVKQVSATERSDISRLMAKKLFLWVLRVGECRERYHLAGIK